ncbi:hypothetical protein [Sorangium sp. So ce131]|uniref:hypothetical protein n=1 Tax=Sorangium sp. So ce131 TaxID=3133282 RepID=UPI003F5EE37E
MSTASGAPASGALARALESGALARALESGALARALESGAPARGKAAEARLTPSPCNVLPVAEAGAEVERGDM